MAICLFQFTPIARSKGESSVKKAAYIRGTRMMQDRTGETYDYSDKKNVKHCNIIIPLNAPKWLKDMLEAQINNHQTFPTGYDNQNQFSQKIWNMSEEVSFKCNARTANSISVALPAELGIDQNIKLLEEFLSDCYVCLGMVADYGIYETAKAENLYARTLLTNRHLTEEGFGAVDKDWNTRSFLFLQRQTWTEKLNKYLEINGFHERVDHRSYKEQGVDLIPSLPLGPGKHHSKKDKIARNEEIRKQNYYKMITNPKIGLNALAKSNKAFTEMDLANFTKRFTSSQEEFDKLYQALATLKAQDEVFPIEAST